METTASLPASLVLVGGGKMGRAMLEGWLALGLPASAATVLDPHPSPELADLARGGRIALNPDLAALPAPEILVLAFKPQMLAAAGPTIAHLAGAGTLVVSILAGSTLAAIGAVLPGAGAVVRAMPNLAASIGRGATGVFASAAVTPSQREAAETLLGGVGLVEWVESEDAIDAVTAVSGSGPAYVFLLVECLAQAGLAAGLEAAVADRLARATIVGAGALLEASLSEPSRLRQDVTSPGGTTAAALAVLMRPAGGLPSLVGEAVLAAKRRAGELAG